MANPTNSVYSIVAPLLILVACVELCNAYTMDVYPLIQYDTSGVPFGSRTASFNYVTNSSDSAISHNVIILFLRELNETFIEEYIEHGKPSMGLLLLLPRAFNFRDSLSPVDDCDHTNEKKQLADLEQKLIHSTIQYPVYFAFEHEPLLKVLADIRRNDADANTTSRYKVIVTSPVPMKLASPKIINIQGWLPGLIADGVSNQLPTIAIVASYDTFGASPALSVGTDSNGSGVAALLEIARLFSVLYSNTDTRGKYNILFGLTSGGPYNYYGTKKWLRSLDQRLRESIDYAICLNSLSIAKNGLWLHVSRPPENVYVRQIFEGVSNVAEELGFQVGLKHKMINASGPRVAWEHEQFSRFGVTAATLSRLSDAPNFLENTGGISDIRDFVVTQDVVRSVRLITESLTRHIYGKELKNITKNFADKSRLAVSYRYIQSWLDRLSTTPRVAPFISHAFIMKLEKELASHILEVNSQQYVMDEMFDFYDSTINKLEVGVVTYDLHVKLVIGLYLFGLVGGLMIITRVVGNLIRPLSGKRKARIGKDT